MVIFIVLLGAFLAFKLGGSSNHTSHYGQSSPGNSGIFGVIVFALSIVLALFIHNYGE